MKTLFINIKELLQIRDHSVRKVSGTAMQILPTLKNAFLLIEHETIVDFGLMEDCPYLNEVNTVDATGRILMPTWVDSHTHLVFAGNRTQEFVDRIKGLTYEEIAERGGGILNSAQKLQESSEDALYESSSKRLETVMKLGTGAIEIKSGYGLTVESEMKMLRVIRRLSKNYPITIKSTFLGAHAIPKIYKENREGYIQLICEEMLPKIASEELADFVDVFLETGYFTVDETIKIIESGKKYGLKPKIHVNQFTAIGGIEACVKLEALSVDHLEILTDQDIEILKDSPTMPVALPSCSFFIQIPYTPARRMIEAGLPLALATDYNPGTTPSGNMNLVVAMACIQMKMTPEEAINAATINAAYAMDIEKTHGSITRGKVASIMLTIPIDSYNEIPYSFGNVLIDRVWIKGVEV
jgi:imidazolonepropionase